MHLKQDSKNNFNLNFWLMAVLAGITLISLLADVVVSARTNIFLNKKIAVAKEATRPAELQVTIITDANCPDCSNLDQLLAGIEKQNAKIIKKEDLTLSDEKAKKLIKQFKITEVPTLLISGELAKSPTLKTLLSKLGKIENGTFVLEQSAPPYTLVNSGEVKGQVEVVMLTDKSCAECYQVTNHEKILNNFGINTRNKKIFDTQEEAGKALIKKYDIKLLPTIILKGDLETYPGIKQVWSKVGTVEPDGAYVFRQGVKQMGIYKDLSIGRVVK